MDETGKAYKLGYPRHMLQHLSDFRRHTEDIAFLRPVLVSIFFHPSGKSVHCVFDKGYMICLT
jgi:hypothetical protein